MKLTKVSDTLIVLTLNNQKVALRKDNENHISMLEHDINNRTFTVDKTDKFSQKILKKIYEDAKATLEDHAVFLAKEVELVDTDLDNLRLSTSLLVNKLITWPDPKLTDDLITLLQSVAWLISTFPKKYPADTKTILQKIAIECLKGDEEVFSKPIFKDAIFKILQLMKWHQDHPTHDNDTDNNNIIAATEALRILDQRSGSSDLFTQI